MNRNRNRNFNPSPNLNPNPSQCLFPPLMMLFAILLLNDIRLDRTI